MNALELLRREEQELEARLARVREAIKILSGGRPVAEKRLEGRFPRTELGEVLDRIETYRGLRQRIYRIPFEAMLAEFRGRKVRIGDVVTFLRERFGFKSPLTGRAYLLYAERKGLAHKDGRSITFK